MPLGHRTEESGECGGTKGAMHVCNVLGIFQVLENRERCQGRCTVGGRGGEQGEKVECPKGLGRGFNPRQERGRGGGGGIKIHTSGGENGKTIPLDQGGDGDEVMGEDGVRAYIAEDGSGVGGEMEVSSLFSKEGPPRREVKGHGWEVGRGEQAG